MGNLDTKFKSTKKIQINTTPNIALSNIISEYFYQDILCSKILFAMFICAQYCAVGNIKKRITIEDNTCYRDNCKAWDISSIEIQNVEIELDRIRNASYKSNLNHTLKDR